MFRFTMVVSLLAWCIAGRAQTFEGFVKDGAKNEPLPGATVQVIGSREAAVTDSQGYFRLTAANGTGEVLVRFVGYKSKTVALTNGVNTILLEEDVIITDDVIVSATRVSEKIPTTFFNLSKLAIQKQNFGQDLPFLLNWTPSVVATSDAGAGVGYTGLRIRGSDATRINVTINGIPLNDSEEQGVFWVNIPDIASSTQNIQIQRGVGSSTNGAASFGATVNLQTNTRNEKPYASIVNSYGSFKTWRHTVSFGSGLVANKFIFDGRLSKISSDGFIDRATSDLKSYYFSAGYYGKKSIVKAIMFGGRETTYQSWWGVPESRLRNDVNAMLETASTEGWNAEQTNNLLNSNSRTFNVYMYENQVDRYGQDHMQLHYTARPSTNLTLNAALHYTRGKGHFEEFRYDDSFSNYSLPDITRATQTISSSDLVRRRWLDNDFYGLTYSLQYEKDQWSSILGGGVNRYVGDHFGEIIWAEVAEVPRDYVYYFNQGDKRDANIFWKNSFSLANKLTSFVDLQYRQVSYQASGKENRQFDFDITRQFNFFNPKVGLTYALADGKSIYASYSVGNREPARSDFVDAPTGSAPKHETLRNVEAGFRYRKGTTTANINYYLMDYRNQLVLTGKVNDVGAPIRTNVAESYRTGIEAELSVRLAPRWQWNGNLTLSANKIQKFSEVLYDYGTNFDEFNEIVNTYQQTDISYSPRVISGSALTFMPTRAFEITWLSKYVGDQFLDNTSNHSRKLDSFFVNDLRLAYQWKPQFMEEISVSVLLNNVFNQHYSSNGYTYGFFGGTTEYRQNYFYPQAGRNYLLMLTLKF